MGAKSIAGLAGIVIGLASFVAFGFTFANRSTLPPNNANYNFTAARTQDSTEAMFLVTGLVYTMGGAGMYHESQEDRRRVNIY